MSRFLTIVGCLILFHAAYSFRHFKHLLISRSILNYTGIPADIIIELGVSFALILIGQLLAFKLKHIRVSADIKSKSFDEVMGRSDFMVFNHRRKGLCARIDALKR